MSTDETMEQWAARVAPTLDADLWLITEESVAEAHISPKVGYTLEEARALLAYRDKVASGLSPSAQAALTCVYHEHVPKAAPTDGFLECAKAGLLAQSGKYETDFGREIVRILLDSSRV